MLTMSQWHEADDASRLATVRSVAELVDGRIVTVESDEVGQRPIFTINVRGVLMVLIPGDAVTLGFDLAASGAPSDDEPLADDGANEESFIEMMTPCCSPTRTVTIAPFLMEIGPSPIEPWLDDLDDEVGLLESVAARVAAEGFRLPTDDEWEHAVRAGSTSVFRWGEEWPDGIPYGNETTFRAHRHRSALGLRMLHDTYMTEVVTHPLGFRGGDGGTAVCGGRPNAEAWFTLSPSFRQPRDRWEDVIFEALETSHVRRVRSIEHAS